MSKLFPEMHCAFDIRKASLAVLLSLMSAAIARADLAAEIDAIATQYKNDNQIPGMVVGVWQGDDAITVLEKGVSNISTSDPVSQFDAFRIASLTKTFTVTRLLQLAGAPGATFTLDDPISNFVPGLQNGDATLRQLANMRSGIFNYTEDNNFILTIADDPGHIWTDQELVNVANSPTNVPPHSPYFAPGANWHYSNTGTVLLGMVVEQVGGATLKSQIDANIIAPLGLTHTVYPSDTTMPDPYAHGYADFFGTGLEDFTGVSPTGSSGSGAMISTLNDLKIWSRALALGTLLTTEMQNERLDLLSTPGGSLPFYDSYGLGIGSIDGWLGHTGDYIGYQALMMYKPIDDLSVVILLNRTNDTNVPTEMFQSMVPLLDAIPEPSTWALLLIGAGLIAFQIKRRARAAS